MKVSVLYPNREGGHFDMDEDLDRHMPMVREKLGAALEDANVEHGPGGAEPGSPATCVAMGHLVFDSVESFHTAFGPHAEAIVGDVPSDTNVHPIIQIGEVKLQGTSEQVWAKRIGAPAAQFQGAQCGQ